MSPNINDLAIEATDIADHARIPDVHTADHDNVAPRLRITGVPEGTVELALISHDPDAPIPHGFTHWVVYGIPPRDVTIEHDHDFRTGPNTLGERAYYGPRPPAGHGVHHYYFWVFALSEHVAGEPTREEFLDQYASAIIEQNRFVATYSS